MNTLTKLLIEANKVTMKDLKIDKNLFDKPKQSNHYKNPKLSKLSKKSKTSKKSKPSKTSKTSKKSKKTTKTKH